MEKHSYGSIKTIAARYLVNACFQIFSKAFSTGNLIIKNVSSLY